MTPGDQVHYHPDQTLPGMAVMLLKYEGTERRHTRRALIAWDDTGVLEQPNGVVRHGFTWRRYRWVPIRHLGVLTPALRAHLRAAERNHR